MMRCLITFAAACSLAVTAATGLSGQNAPDWNSAQLYATRSQLEELLARYEQAAHSKGYSSNMRERARYEATLIRERLHHGDFRTGDRIFLYVEGEPTLSDTLIVSADTSAKLPSGEVLSLKNVLRSEVHDRLYQATARVARNPIVRTETFLRIGIMGAVGKQGFFEIRSDALFSDVLMNVGGVSAAANLEDVRVERDKEKIWEGRALQDAVIEGRTIDQLSMRAGDIIVVPVSGKPKSVFTMARSVLMLAAPLYMFRRLTGWP